ncbi:MAG: RDD family protein, partial [Bdellovibrionales bacterium]|nr:RDD family protein [Bdellovibrionales bacterium]
MVIDDVFRSEINKKNHRLKESLSSSFPRLADPIDRLAAAIIDISVVLLPLVLLMSAPAKKILVSAVLVQDKFLFFSAVMSIFFITLVTVVSYQTLFIYFFGATLGKMIFRMKVKDVWNHQRVTFASALLRSLLWFFETAFFMLPHITIFSDS